MCQLCLGTLNAHKIGTFCTFGAGDRAIFKSVKDRSDARSSTARLGRLQTLTGDLERAHAREAFKEMAHCIHARHILFEVTPGVPVAELRARAEHTLAHLLRAPERFDAVPRELSSCPSGQHGGNLGQIGRGDTVPEFEQALFRLASTDVLGEVVKTRQGFHIVAVDQRIPGETLSFETVRTQIAERLQTCVEERALRQYVSILAGQADIVGVDLQGAQTPLVQ